MSRDGIKTLRLERDGYRDAEKAYRAKADEAAEKAQALDNALAVLTGKAKPEDEPQKRTRISRGRVSGKVREQQVLDAMREGQPGTEWEPGDFAAKNVPNSTAIAVANRLVARGEVEQVGETKRGAPIIKLKQTSVKPGQPPRTVGTPERLDTPAEQT